jgi:hypothetical protein
MKACLEAIVYARDNSLIGQQLANFYTRVIIEKEIQYTLSEVELEELEEKK